MRKFEMTASMALNVAVPDEFVKKMREEAAQEDASVFLKEAQATHPQDDDEFILMILRNGLKRHIRDSVLELMSSSGIGGTFSPVSLKHTGAAPTCRPALAREIAEAIPA